MVSGPQPRAGCRVVSGQEHGLPDHTWFGDLALLTGFRNLPEVLLQASVPSCVKNPFHRVARI